MRIWRAMGLFLMVAALGCGSNLPAPEAANVQAPSAKALLEELAKTGEVGGSATMEIGRALDELKATDAAKGEALIKEFAELQKSAGNPEEVKAKAKAMADKL